MNSRIYQAEQSFPLPIDLESLIAFLEDLTSTDSVFGGRLREAYIKKDKVGKVGRSWLLTYDIGFLGSATYAQDVVFHVIETTLPTTQVDSHQLSVRVVCKSKQYDTVHFYDDLLNRMAQMWQVTLLKEELESPEELHESHMSIGMQLHVKAGAKGFAANGWLHEQRQERPNIALKELQAEYVERREREGHPVSSGTDPMADMRAALNYRNRRRHRK